MGGTSVFAAINAGSNTMPARHVRSGRKRNSLCRSAPTVGKFSQRADSALLHCVVQDRVV